MIYKKYLGNEARIITKFSIYDEKRGKELIKKGIYNIISVKHEPVIHSDKKFVEYIFTLKYTMYKDPIAKILIGEDGVCHSYVFGNYALNYRIKYLYAFLYYLLNEYNELDYDLIEEKFKELEEKIAQEKYEQKRAEYTNILNTTIKRIKAYDNLKSNTKIKVYCCIEPSNDNYTLTCKVGNDKKYFIKNLYDFIHNVKYQKINSYGKGLTFNHSLNSFDETSKKTIKFISDIVTIFTKKEMILYSSSIETLLEIYKNDYIYLNTFDEENKYYVSNEKISPKILLDENFNLKLLGIDKLIDTFSKAYCIKNGVIYELESKESGIVELAKLINSNKIEDFSIVKDIVLDEIYPRFANSFEIEEKVKTKIKLDDYKIEAYFDYEDNVIKLQNKYFLKNEEINLNNLEKIPYNIKRYQTYIENLGFINNIIMDEYYIYNFLTSDLSELKTLAQIYLSDKLSNFKVKKYSSPKMQLSYNIGLLNISMFNSEFTNEELYEILKGIKKNKKYIKLKDDTIISIDEQDAQKLLNTVTTFNLDAKNLNEEQQIPLYNAFKTKYDYVDIIDYKNDNNIISLVDEIINFKNNKFPLSKKFKEVMRDYQIDAYNWMNTLVKHGFSGILADDMGLGKTLEIISVISENKNKKPSLIVCPKSLCYNWKNEFNKWDREIEVVNIIGNSQTRKDIINSIDPKSKTIYISSYDSLRNDIELYKKINFNFLVLDEAQSIKNNQTLKAQSVKTIKSTYRFVLTGTPIENSVMDLWSIFDFLMPNYLGDQKTFKKLYEEAALDGRSNELINGLIRKISPFVLRRTKKEVLKDLPEKIETIRIATMDDDQQKLYDANILAFKESLENPEITKVEILALLTRLRQICVNPKLCYENYEGNNAKFDLLYELINEYIKLNHKIIVFSQFTQALDIITKEFENQNIKYFMLTGKTSAEKRIEMAEKFNKEDDLHKVFLVSLKAGGTGLNLVGADIVIHLDPWWNYAVENQATDRAHRIGQKNVVQVIKLIIENTIEQKVIELQKLKKEVAEKIILSDEQNYNSITLTDVRYLLE